MVAIIIIANEVLEHAESTLSIIKIVTTARKTLLRKIRSMDKG